MAINTEFVGYQRGITDEVAFGPRPGLDLDAGVRLQTGPKKKRIAPITQPQINGYDHYSNGGFGYNPILATYDHIVWLQTDMYNPPYGPEFGMQPDEVNKWAYAQLSVNGFTPMGFDQG